MGRRQRQRLDRIRHGRARGQQLHQPLGGAGRPQQVAVHLRQHRDTAHQDDHVDDGLPEVAGADAAFHHRFGALVQAPQQRAEGGGDDERDEVGAHAGAFAGGLEGVLGGGVEAGGFAGFLRVALHDGNGVEHLGGDGAGVGDAVLAGAAELAHAAAEVQRRQHDQHQDAQHLRHHQRVGDDQHHHRAEAHHRVAQAHRQAGADDALHQRRVGGQPGEHFAGLRRLEELGALAHDVGVDGVAQVGGDALAEPAHHVEARGREHAQGGADCEQRQEMFAQRHHPLARVGGDEPLVDQRAQRHREHQRADSGQHEEQARQPDLQAVGAEKGLQTGEGARARGARAFGGGSRHGRECRRVSARLLRSAVALQAVRRATDIAGGWASVW